MKKIVFAGIAIGVMALAGIFVFSSLYKDSPVQDSLPNVSDNKFEELKWDWYGPTSFTLGEPITFSVSRMDKFCNDTFYVKIVNQDYSKTFWQESSAVECSNIMGGKISKATFPIEKPIDIVTPGTYFVVADFANFEGFAMLSKKITIEPTENNRVIINIPYGSADSSLMKSFEPQEATVIIGVNNTVMWVNQDEVGSTIISDSNYEGTGFASPYLSPGESWQFTFTKPGTFGYHSDPHPWKTGKITVIENNSTLEQESEIIFVPKTSVFDKNSFDGDVVYDDLVSRKVLAYSIPAAEIIPERNCYKFSQSDLADIPPELDYMIRESIPQNPDDYDGDGYYDGFSDPVPFDVARQFLEKYEFKLTKETREWGLQKIPDTKYTYECIFEYDSHQYKLGFVFDTHYDTDMKIVFVNFTKNDSGQPAIENDDPILFSGGFNGTIALVNKLDHDITIQIQNPPAEGDWSEHLLLASITIPKGKVWSETLRNFHTSEDLVYRYTVLEDQLSGQFTLKSYPRCMTDDQIKSLYSQVGVYPVFPRYIPDGYWLECGGHNTNFAFFLAYYTGNQIEQFPDTLNAAFNYDFLESGGLVIHYTDNGWSEWDKVSTYDKWETAKSYESKFTNSTMVNGNPAVFSKVYFWRDGHSRSFNSLSIFLDDQVRYEIKGGIPQDEIIKIADSIVP